MNKVTKSIIQLVVFTTLGGLILYFLWQNLSASYAEDCLLKGITAADCSLMDKMLTDFKSVSIFWLVVMCITYMVSCVFRALRWMMLFRPLGYNVSFLNSFFTVMVGYFANMGLPRMGEFIRAGLFSKYEEIPYEKVLGTIVLGRIVDAICLLLLIVLGLLIHREVMMEYFMNNLNLNTQLLIWLAVIGIVLLIIAVVLYRKLAQSSKSPLFLKVRKLIDGFLEGMISLKKVKNLPLFIFYSIGIWLLYVMMHWIGFLSFEPTAHLSMTDSILAFDFAALGMVFPSPGGMGSYHAMLVEALQILHISPVEAFSIAMITYFTLNIFCNVIFGLISLILLPIINAK